MVARRPSSSGSSKEYPEGQRGCFCRYINMATARKLLHTSGVLLLILLIIFLWHSATASPHCNSYGYYCYNATHYADCRARAGLAAGGVGGGGGGDGGGGVHMCPDGGLCADNLPSRCQSALTDCGRSDHVCLNATHFQLCVETSVGTMLRMGSVESCGPYMQCRDDVSVMCAEVALPPTADTLLTREGDKRCNAFGYRCLNATHYVQCGDGERARAAEACPPGNMCSHSHPSICAEPVSSPCSSFGHVCINDTHFETCVLDSNGNLYTAGQVDRCLGGTLCSNDSSTICYYPYLRNNQENDWKDREENSGIDTVVRSSGARNTFDDTRLNNSPNNTHPSVLWNRHFEMKNSSESFDDASENHEVTTELLIELSSTPSANLTSKLSDNVKMTVLNQIENSSAHIYDQDEEQLEKQLDEIVTRLEPTSTISPGRKESSQSLFDQNKSDIDFKENKIFVNNSSNDQQGDSTSSSEINYNKESKNEANAYSIVREIIENITVYSGNNYKESTTLSYDSSLGKAPDDRETNQSTSTESLPSHVLLINNGTDEVSELTNPTFPAYNNSLHLISVKTWSPTEDSHVASNKSNFTHTLPNESLEERSENETQESTREFRKLQAGNTNMHVTEQSTDKYENDSFTTSNEVSEFFPKDSKFTVQCEENGKFSHPSGNASLFYCCINSGRQYTILTYECPPKSVFNPLSQQCVISEVEIQISIQKDIDDINDRREINDTCTQPGKFPSSSANCSHFYVCIPFRNTFIKRDLICPFESEFNAIYMRCTVPQKANCSIKHNGTYWDIRDDDDTDAYTDLMNRSSEVKSLDSQDAFSEQEYYTETNSETPPIQQFDDIFPEENGFGMFDTEEKDDFTTKDSVNVMDTTVSENFIYRTTVYNNIKDIFTEKISVDTTDDRTNIVSELKSDSIQQNNTRENYESSTTTEDSTNYETTMTPEQKYFTVTNRAYNERVTVSISEGGANIDGTEENYDSVNDDIKGESYETLSHGYLDSTTEYSTTAEGTTNDDTTMSPEQEYFTIKNDAYNERVTVPISEVETSIDDTEEHDDALSENIKGQTYEIGSQGYLYSSTEYSTNTEYTTKYESTMTPQQEYFTVTNDVYNERVTTPISEAGGNIDGIITDIEQNYDTLNDDVKGESYETASHGYLDGTTEYSTTAEGTTNGDTTMTPEQEYFAIKNDAYNERVTVPISEVETSIDDTEEHDDALSENIKGQPYEIGSQGYLDSTTEYSTNTEYTTKYESTMTPQQEYFTVTNDVYNERVATSISEVATNFDGIVAGAEENYDTFNDDINGEPYGSVMHGHLDSVTKSRTADEYTTTMTPEKEYYSGTNDVYNERLTMPISEADANIDGIITGTEENYDTFNDNINREPYETVTYGYLGSATNALIWDYREITTEVADASFADESTNDPTGDDTAIPIDSFKIDEDTESYLEFYSSPIPETTHVSFETGSTPLPKGDVESRDKSHFTDSSTGENTTENPFVTVTQTPSLSIVPVVTEHSIFNNTNIDTSLSTGDSIPADNLYDLTEDVNYDYQDAALGEYSTENTIIDSTTILSNDRLISENSEIKNIHTEAVFTNTFTEHITRRIGNNPNAPPDTVTVMNSPKEYITSKSAVSEVEDNTDDATTPIQAATFSSPAQISSDHTERLVNDPMEYSMINIPDSPVTYITDTTRLPVTYITTDSTETIIPAHNTVASTKDNEEPMVVRTTNGVTIASTERVDHNQHATNFLTEVVSDFIQTDTSTAPNEVENSDKNDHYTRSEITVLGTQVPDFIPKYVSIASTGITTEDISEYFTSNLASEEGTTENHYNSVREGSEHVITAPQVSTNRDTTDSNLTNEEYHNPNSIPNSLENTHTTTEVLTNGSAETVTVTRSTMSSSPHFTQNISDSVTHNAMEISERDDQVVTPMINYDVTTVAVPQIIDDIAVYDVTYADSTTENVIITEESDNSISITPKISTSATEVIKSEIVEEVTTVDTVPGVDRMNQQPNKNTSMEASTPGIDVMNFTRSNQSTDITTIIVGTNSPSLNYGTTTRENTSTYHSQLSNSSVPTSTDSNASEQHSGFQDSVDMLHTNNPSSRSTTTSSLDPHVHHSTFSEITSATPTSTSTTINEQLKETDDKHLSTSDVSQTSENTAETSLSTSGIKRTSTTTYLPVIKTSTPTPASSLLPSTDNTKYSTPSSTSIISSTSRTTPPSSETLTSTTQSIFVCNSIGKFPNPYDVKSYYVCSRRYGGGFHTMKFLCPSTSRYFIEIQKCADVLWSTGSATSQRRARFVRRSVDDVGGDPGTREDQLDCRSSRTIADPLQCDTYFICVERESGKFSRLTLKCPTGFSFDPEAEKCVWDYPCGVISRLYD